MRTAQEHWDSAVHDVLKRLDDPVVLEQHPAQTWNIVQARCAGGMHLVHAIRGVISDAITALEAIKPNEAKLLRQHYLERQTIEELAQKYILDTSHMHRRRNRAVRELALVLFEREHDLKRRRAAERFHNHQPTFGLDALVSDLVSHLHHASAAPVLVIEGMGGLGKTTLAQHVAAASLAEDGFIDVLWTTAKQSNFDVWAGRRDATRETAINVDDLLVGLAQELQMVVPNTAAEVRREVIAHCRQQPYLIVFDNLETVADMAALAPVLERIAGLSRVLITTRDRAVDALPATLVRRYLTLHELDEPTSLQVLRSAASLAGATTLVQARDAELARIYAVTGGNPLALQLVAGQAHGLPWETFINDLVERCPPQSSSYELYEYLYRRAWEHLSHNAKIVLFAMHRCEHSAFYELLFELSGLDHESFHTAVKELIARMLLNFNGHYTIHRLTYSFLRVVIAGWWA